MWGILLAVTNEQLGESVKKLEEKVESLNTVKELQDKVISIQDHQISFLNDSIANMWQPIAAVSGLIGLVFTGAFAYVTYLNRQAQNKVTQATEEMARAQESMKEAQNALNQAEQKIEHLEQQLQNADTVVNKATAITHVAQNKLSELETEQKEIINLANSIENNQRIDMLFTQSRLFLDLLREDINTTRGELHSWDMSKEQADTLFDHFKTHIDFEARYKNLSFSFSNTIARRGKLSPDEEKNIEETANEIRDFFMEYLRFINSIEKKTDIEVTTANN